MKTIWSFSTHPLVRKWSSLRSYRCALAGIVDYKLKIFWTLNAKVSANREDPDAGENQKHLKKKSADNKAANSCQWWSKQELQEAVRLAEIMYLVKKSQVTITISPWHKWLKVSEGVRSNWIAAQSKASSSFLPQLTGEQNWWIGS